MKQQGYWLVTPKRGENHRFKTTKAMVEFVRKRPGCIISWITPK